MPELAGRVAVVTGGGGGIGAVAARVLADLGAEVVICGRTPERLYRVSGERPGQIHPFPMDVTDTHDWRRVHGWIASDLPAPATVLVTAAGVNHRGPFLSSTPEQWRDLWQTNVVGTLLSAQTFLPDMLEAGFGRIVVISSAGARIGLTERIAYSATKAAVEAFARGLAAEVGPTGVTVNCLAPGAMPTELTSQWLDARPDVREEIVRSVPVKRLGEPSELAAAIQFLATSTYSQGSTVVVDGGWTAV